MRKGGYENIIIQEFKSSFKKKDVDVKKIEQLIELQIIFIKPSFFSIGVSRLTEEVEYLNGLIENQELEISKLKRDMNLLKLKDKKSQDDIKKLQNDNAQFQKDKAKFKI